MLKKWLLESTWGRGLIATETKNMIRGLELWDHLLPLPLGKGEGLEVGFSHQGPVIQSVVPASWSPTETQSTGFREFLGWWACGGAGRVAGPERAWEPCTRSHVSYPVHLFHLAVPKLYPFIINWQGNCFPEFCEVCQQINQTQGRSCGNLLLVGQKQRWLPGLGVGIWGRVRAVL